MTTPIAAEPIPLSQFFQECRDDLVRFFVRKLQCPDTAHDLAQETFIRLHFCEQRAPSQDRRALAFFIAGNLVIDHIRKENVRARYSPNDDSDTEAIEALPCPGPDSVRHLIAAQELAAVQSALAELPDDHRTAFYLSAIDGLTYAEIGERLGVSDRIIAKRIAQTLKHCRACRDAS
ncbi:RNA polymerase sigma factor [Methylococcaceae bacterium WWC4]|nr:RNA polymerase sigma factor [Methylococcaceae bacterium WWC4]